ncbi:UDP-2,4-diacetamido-2,4,6-trideoxy-beta-L-altropyranose hydrolase [Nostoc sp. TCL26-01]|uniref:UDP-2,4-diacetamido-2,4, 6-trideoxy-beta-L-altropyranose hydrolase n=1 Tax=Nostoc sp. TCL26-01 TaxID=2576904 RepID=UPI0015C0402B|nr:UDP-2,4-diacetamido-2,4,6-trideoxy-beta-L-altropyranose hydrolase [Nostoc sp. TCL26-01]
MNLLFRVDVSTQIGTGHLMRCLALAQAWQDAGGKAVFVMANIVPVLEKRLISEGIEILKITNQLATKDAETTAMLVNKFNSDWLVIDGYHFDDEYQKIIKSVGLKILFIDDYGHVNHYYADIVLNQNISADGGLYTNREPYTQLLLGTRYTLLRREFWQWQGWQRINPSIASKILITMGGADIDNVTLKVIQGLQLLSDYPLEVLVVIGGSNPHYDQLKSAAEASKFPIRLENNVINMPELIAWADLAITAGGSTCWELAFMGLPSLIIILAENQQAIAQKLHSLKAAINLGWYHDISADEIALAVNQLSQDIHRRLAMSKSSQSLVDGSGSQRIVRYLKNYLLKLRSVSIEDCELLWQWANDPEVRVASFSSEFIGWEEHLQWFKSKLNSPNCIFYIALNEHNIPIGQIRYEIEAREAVISISIAQQFRHQGYGSYLIELAQKQIFKNIHIVKIHAYIKQNNQASIRTFTKTGFQIVETVLKQEKQAIHLVSTGSNLL